MPHARHAARYKILGRRLQAARIAAGLTQEQAANRMGYPQTFISKCERAYRRVDVIELEEFATTYNVPISRFHAPLTADENRLLERDRARRAARMRDADTT